MIFVGDTLGVQEWDPAKCARGFHGEFMCGPSELRRLKKLFPWLFFAMLMTSHTYFFHHGLGMGPSGPNANSSKYSI